MKKRGKITGENDDAPLELAVALLDVFLSGVVEGKEGGAIDEFALSMLLLKEMVEGGDKKSAMGTLNAAIRLSKKYAGYDDIGIQDYRKILRGDVTPQYERELLNGNRRVSTSRRFQI